MAADCELVAPEWRINPLGMPKHSTILTPTSGATRLRAATKTLHLKTYTTSCKPTHHSTREMMLDEQHTPKWHASQP